MSFDVFVFERRKEIGCVHDVQRLAKQFCQYEEERDYYSLEGSSDCLKSFAESVFAKFPPLNGEYAGNTVDLSEAQELYLTDYYFGKQDALCMFSQELAEDAFSYLQSMLESHNVGIYLMQKKDMVYGAGLLNIQLVTEAGKPYACGLQEVEEELKRLSDSSRCTDRSKLPFVLVYCEGKGEDCQAKLKCSPIYEAQGLFAKFLHKKPGLKGYLLEIHRGKERYQRKVESVPSVMERIESYCKLGDVTDLQDYIKIA